MEVLHRAATEKPKSPRLTNARISRDLETICLKCLEKEPGARYVSAAALADDLERFCAGHTIQARPVGLANRAWHWSRRNPGLAALSVLSVALLVVLAAIFTTGGTTRASVAPPKTIAVLPFTTSSGDTARSYFTSGMQEEILAHLRKINGLVTLSSRTIAQAGEKTKDVRELRRAVGASYVLQGNVQPANERVVVTIQLTDTRTAKPVWTKKFESEIAGISAVQKSIAEDVVTQLKGKLASGEKAAIEQGRVHDLQVYELYLQARSVLRYFGNPGGGLDFTRPKAIELLSKPSHAIRSLASLMPYSVRLRLRRSMQRIRPRNKWPKPWRPRRWRWRLSLNWLRATWSSALTITRCLSKRVEAPITGLETKSAGWKNGKPPSDSRRITQRSLRSSLRLQSIAVIGKGLSKNWSGHGK